MKSLQAQGTSVHIGDRAGVTEHNLLHEDVENALLYCGLGFAGCGAGKVARDDDENLNVIEGTYGLQTDWLRRGGMTENKDEMWGDGIPRDVQRPMVKSLNC